MFNPIKNTLRLYRYRFLCMDEPVTIEAMDRKQARIFLIRFITANERYHNVPVIGETVSLPVTGVTEKIENGVHLVWSGYKYSPTGWMIKFDFDKLNLENP